MIANKKVIDMDVRTLKVALIRTLDNSVPAKLNVSSTVDCRTDFNVRTNGWKWCSTRWCCETWYKREDCTTTISRFRRWCLKGMTLGVKNV